MKNSEGEKIRNCSFIKFVIVENAMQKNSQMKW